MELETIREIDLAGTWEFTPECGRPAPIHVPGGGWLKQGFDCEAGAYQRRIIIPDSGRPQVTRLELGAVNHLAEYFIGPEEKSLHKVYEEVTAFTPQVVDLTPHVSPGRNYLLRIAVRAYQDGRPIAPHWAEWCEWIARGIFRGTCLRVYPELYVADGFVKSSVANNSLICQAWLTNTSGNNRMVILDGRFSSSNGQEWGYPRLPRLPVELLPGETRQVDLGPVQWTPGPASYWWPNVPYRPGYRAHLHTLHLTISEGGAPLHSAAIRFGFRECRQAGKHFELNGIRVNFRGDNLQVANYDRVDHDGRGDAIDTLPGFLPPSPDNPGWPKAVDNFLRLNYNVQRQHMGPWTPYMLDVCDEQGLMLIGESATRWNGFDMEDGRGFHEVKCLQDIIRRDRNHPCIVRWSSKNEAQCPDPAYHVELYEAIKVHDDTRPISEDIVVANWNAFDVKQVFAPLLDRDDFTWIDHYITYDKQGVPFFTPIEHNDAVIPLPDRPFGLGEADWMRSSTPAGLAWFATTIALARAQGASDVRPYVLLSSWASSIPGVKTSDFLTEENRRPVYGEDNLLDPWAHPRVRLLQRACHPLLALDYEFWKANRASNSAGHFPVSIPAVKAGERIAREITVFNDEFSGSELVLRWEVREGSPANWAYDQGEQALKIAPGFMATAPIAFAAPSFNTTVFLILRVLKDGIERYADDLTCFDVFGGTDFRPEFNSGEGG